MEELITQEQFAAGLRVFLVLAFLCCWAGGVVYGYRMRRLKQGVVLGALCSVLAPLTYGLWLLFCHNVRYDPVTGTAGLHRVSVLLLNLAIFVAVGTAIGLAAALVRKAGLSSGQETTEHTEYTEGRKQQRG